MSTENEGLLEVRDLKVHFPLPKKSLFGERSYVKAVDGVSFRVRKGTTFGIVGESGSGKTTIAKAVMGLVGVSGGSIRLEGNELVGIPEDRLKALRPKYQIVFQDPYSSLNPRMRVGKIVQDPLNLMDMGSHEEREEREKEVFEQIGLHQAQRALFPHQFSGGQRQRISIGRALASYPELIICDEPVSALDVAIQAQILNLFMDLQEKNNLTYLFISHDLGVVQHMCDDIGVMYLGRFAEVADKVSLFTSPAHPYTYSLLSVVPQVSRSPKGGRVKLLGDPPSPIDLKPGCRFNTRCPFAEDVFLHEEPELRKIGDNHFVACHLVRDGLGPHQRDGEWKV